MVVGVGSGRRRSGGGGFRQRRRGINDGSRNQAVGFGDLVILEKESSPKVMTAFGAEVDSVLS